MAKVTSMFQIEGTIGGVTFFKTKDGYFARMKTSVSKRRLMKDPAYARTRDNMAVFARAAQAAKLVRTAFRPLLNCAADSGITSRLLSSMHRVITSDTMHDRAERTVQDGNLLYLEGFEFNEDARLSSTLLSPIRTSISRKSGSMVIDITPFDPKVSMRVPAGATHFRLFSGGAAIDFASTSYTNATSESAYHPVNADETEPIRLVMELPPSSPGALFLLLGIEFVQIIDEKPTAVRNGKANALAIAKISDRLPVTIDR